MPHSTTKVSADKARILDAAGKLKQERVLGRRADRPPSEIRTGIRYAHEEDSPPESALQKGSACLRPMSCAA